MRTLFLTVCLAALALATPAAAQIGIGARMGGNVGVGTNVGVGVRANTDVGISASDKDRRHPRRAWRERHRNDNMRASAYVRTQNRAWWEHRRTHGHVDARSDARSGFEFNR